MRLYGLLDTDDYGYYYLITTIATNPDYLDGNIYYTDKDAACIFNIYNSNQIDWFPWNCDIIEDNMFFKDGKYYDEREISQKIR